MVNPSRKSDLTQSIAKAEVIKVDPASGAPSSGRALRAQGRRTMQRLLDAGLKVFAKRGYHAARVDDIVKAAKTSHGTFYLYFTNKEDLLRVLAVDCAEELIALSSTLGAVSRDQKGWDELRSFLGNFTKTYQRYGPVIRAWMENQVQDSEIDRLGVKAFTAVGDVLGRRMKEAGVDYTVSETVTVAAFMAMLERVSYGVASGRIIEDEDLLIDTMTSIAHRGFFGASAILD
ncbi:unannotated protein [freshwater metagenome]|jgi:AcrR family transcriptional regulator|uniref:Unannotated protein n=1 Tax=freshwater metagenome TaxID=449393 RepID=A0A6J6STU7_9ZZZZ|nr:TetR/AcrR family transcriptional regulator [Actinomycetota bacterium]MSV40144.1 TetR family transcriptional regulator [Actinomycetota bacterium]MSV93775.1 TetR family transcriptional regulator [Actinomycetota bacterium]MSW60298.1 TetR family transcriptional regulator [Actinomycetota bacterium]MSY45755.1 TetR family transcriptional regulator [Actinomycetota bacterium]